jgi:hypothetical protein
MAKLTAISVEKIKPAAGRMEIPDAACRGLYLVVQPSGHKSFAVRYRFAGKPRKLTLTAGSTLAEARAAAAAAMNDVDKGIDPSVVKRTQTRARKEAQATAEANTFRAVAENYFKRKAAKLRSVDWQRHNLARLVYPEIGDVPIGELKRARYVAMLDKIEDRNGATMADMALAMIRPILVWHSPSAACRASNATSTGAPASSTTMS